MKKISIITGITSVVFIGGCGASYISGIPDTTTQPGTSNVLVIEATGSLDVNDFSKACGYANKVIKYTFIDVYDEDKSAAIVTCQK